MQIRDRKAFVTGLLFISIGLFAMLSAQGYKIGSAARMGPGWFPLVLGGVLSALGLSVLLSALSRRAGESFLPRIDWPVLAAILGPVGFFALTLVPLGLFLAVICLVLLSTLADSHRNWRHSLITAVTMAFISTVIFKTGLGIPLPLLPVFLQ